MIDKIRLKISQNLFELSQHVVDQSILRHISIRELRESFENSYIIEDYPDDKYSPSCLILGFTRAKRPNSYSMQLSFKTFVENNNPL